jgi:serine/threonine protein kinase
MALMPIPDRWASLPGMGLIGPRLWRGVPSGSSETPSLDHLLDDFTRRWERGEAPRAEDYVGQFPSGDADGPLELVYHEYCLAESSGLAPDPSAYFVRFPELEGRLRKVLDAHGEMPGFLGLDTGPELPVAGDEIGPYLLVRELGRGAFARVFLAKQTDLDDRLLVVKVSARPTAEARLMARADHPHIVAIHRDAVTEEGLHLVCMPFLGGGTLGAVLDRLGREGRRPGWGGSILEALDAISAGEYPSALAAGTTRELLDGTSYTRALAWMMARLAGALDHAFSKGVTHGDLKPSNILLAADGRPMLLDFNLSTDWTDEDSTLSGDPGGTLAYMAPERLLALAGRLEGPPPACHPIDRHRADVYSLGLILLEALTGKRPEVPAPSQPGETPEALAGRLAHLRGGLPDSSVGGARGPLSRTSWPASVPAGLRPVLSRCLDPSPSRRYKNSRQLADDLDRWRDELPLKHARPSRLSELFRHLHRQRRAIASFFLVCAVCAVAAGLIWRAKRMEQREQSLQNVAEIWDHIDTGVYRFWAPGHTKKVIGEEGAEIGFAWRLLERYEVANNPAWRERAEFAVLPEGERHDLEALLLEQAVRFALEITRPEYNDLLVDRAVAAAVLENLGDEVYPPEMDPLRQALGVLRTRAEPARKADWRPIFLGAALAEMATAEDIERLGLDRMAISSGRALRAYLKLSSEMPRCFWFHFRTAVMASRLRKYSIAETSIRQALGLRPKSAPAHLALSGVHYYQGRLLEASAACDEAKRLDPRAISVGRTAFFVATDERVKEAELARLKALAGRGRGTSMVRFGAELHRLLRSSVVPALVLFRSEMSEGVLSDTDLRYWRGSELSSEGRWKEALEEYDRVLEADPDHTWARFDKGVALQYLGRTPEAVEDYERVLADPRFEEILAQEPPATLAYSVVAAGHLRRGEISEGIALSIRGLARSLEWGDRIGEAYYSLGRAYGVAAYGDASKLRDAAREIFTAGGYSEKFLTETMVEDPLLAPMLPVLQAELLDQMVSRD